MATARPYLCFADNIGHLRWCGPPPVRESRDLIGILSMILFRSWLCQMEKCLSWLGSSMRPRLVEVTWPEDTAVQRSVRRLAGSVVMVNFSKAIVVVTTDGISAAGLERARRIENCTSLAFTGALGEATLSGVVGGRASEAARSSGAACSLLQTWQSPGLTVCISALDRTATLIGFVANSYETQSRSIAAS